jgi:hypothetical protein
MERRFFIAAMIVLTAAFIVSCSDDLEVNNGNGQQGQNIIQFSVDDSQDWEQKGNDVMTRSFSPYSVVMEGDTEGKKLFLTSSVVNGINSNGLAGCVKDMTRGVALQELPSEFGVSCYTNSTVSTVNAANWFYNQKVVKNSNNWEWTSPQYWPTGNNYVRFYAFAPYTETGSSTNLIFSSQLVADAPTIDYTVPATVSSQQDLMCAASYPVQYQGGETANLHFKHALTCVKFALGANVPGVEITNITLKNIVSHGIYHFDEETPYWTLQSDTTDFSIPGVNFPTSQTGNTIKFDNDPAEIKSTLLMIPQSFNQTKQKVVVRYKTSGGGYNDIEATLNGSVWLAGTTVTYTLSCDPDFEFILEVGSTAMSRKGGDGTFSVVSYRQDSNGNNKQAVPWHVAGYSVNGSDFVPIRPDAADWVTLLTTHGTGGILPQYGKIVMEEQQASSTTNNVNALDDANQQTAIMKANGIRGTENNRYDLSTHNQAGVPMLQNTANCYIINAPGYYKIPLVYGNVIQNGDTVKTAYTNSINLNHDGVAIKGPRLAQNGTLGSAVLLWQDEQNLIKKVDIDTDNEYLLVDVDENNIKQGNALVAVKNSAGTVMWSWHLWFTAIDVYAKKRVVNAHHRVYYFMPVPLGWCSEGGNQSVYEGRNVKVLIRQDGSNKTAILNLSQLNCLSYESGIKGTFPVYQWGRKDPLKPMGYSGYDKPYYDISNNTLTLPTANASAYKQSIQNPRTLYKANANGDWCTTQYYSVWNAGGQSTKPTENVKITKTIYDPCPVGYCIPDIYAGTGFIKADKGTSADTYLHATFSDCLLENTTMINSGYYFYTDNSKTETFYMPKVGNRSADNGTVSNYPESSSSDTYGLSWMANRWVDHRCSFWGAHSTYYAAYNGGSRDAWGRHLWGISYEP